MARILQKHVILRAEVEDAPSSVATTVLRRCNPHRSSLCDRPRQIPWHF